MGRIRSYLSIKSFEDTSTRAVYQGAMTDLLASAATDSLALAASSFGFVTDEPAEVTFHVLLSKKSEIDAAFEKLAKRCEKKGLPDFTWTWGKATTTVQRQRLTAEQKYKLGAAVTFTFADGISEVQVARVALTVHTPRPCFEGWWFAATLTHLAPNPDAPQGENIVRGVPGVPVPKEFRTVPSQCQHCETKRRRSATYVLSHEDGRAIQVGSTCLGDFLGTDTATNLATAAEIYALVSEMSVRATRWDATEACDERSGSSALLIDTFLPCVAWCIRNVGWVSKKVAYESNGKVQATADLARAIATDRAAARDMGVELSETDYTLAAEAAAWAENLTDAEVDAGSGDYLHNLRAAIRSGVASVALGIVASVITAYERAKKPSSRPRMAAAVSKHVGTVNEKLMGLPVTLAAVGGFDTQYGYKHFVEFTIAAGLDAGAALVWFTGSDPQVGHEDIGKPFALTGTIKKHSEYKGRLRTEMTRCKFAKVSK